MTDERAMTEALIEAKKAKNAGELPFGAVIVKEGGVLSRGRCHEQGSSSVLCHAEAQAVDRACKKLQTTNLSGCTIYCTNEPCVMCAAAIFQAKIPRVVIGLSRSDNPHLRPRKISIVDIANDSGFEVTIIRGVKKEAVLELFDL